MPLIQVKPDVVINTDHIVRIQPYGADMSLIEMRENINVSYQASVEDTLIHIRQLVAACTPLGPIVT